ncbi:general secretion pathway protein GspN [Alicycliphilus denitrificans]|uniref:Type II secretion system protein N n=1 Tax=Alicycliphilus denitrificans TaxID=179636 RepID=A0A3R7F0H9_9BURK|nr:type II secretion system protein N [Alicycliphilus denitrificans]MBN9574865.1 type II secretion system protein N [Alicycliphilus denitrificans]OJW89233.1 MAG: general secretion pathway protein GspN [Alicycliphilus sp. 69-12]RKJ98452.1 type II secretion system protein N [Alicycliphilus denitrificans]BCN37521.1 general secretion pathway protein GspN [Alicycliphilus denitrificans]
MSRRPPSRSPTATPRAPWRWAVAGLCLGVLPALALWAPARWLAAGVQQASGGQLRLEQARGTVWTGSARLVLTGGAGSDDRAALPGRLAWRLRPAWGGARASIMADCCTAEPLALRAALGLGSARVQVADGSSQWPAAVLGGLGTPWNTVQPQGRLQLSTQGLALQWSDGRMQLQGQAQLDALGMSTRLSTLRPMGSYRLVLQGGRHGEAPTLQLSTLDGALLLSGSGQWVGQRLRFTGEARAAPEREAALANLLNIIGRRSGARSIITLG